MCTGQPKDVKNTKEEVQTLKSSKIWRKNSKTTFVTDEADQNGFDYLRNSFSSSS